MGIASYDLTGDGYPDVYLTSQGDNRLQTLTGGPGRSRPTATSGSSAASTPPSRSPVATRCPRPPGIPSSRTSTTTASSTCSSSKGNVDEQPDYAKKDPSNLLLGQPDGTFIEGAEAAGIVDFAQGPRRGAGRLQPRRPARPRRGQLRRPGAGCGGTSGPATPRRPRRWATGSALRPTSPAPNRDAIGGLDRGPGRRRDDPARADRRRRPRERRARLDPLSGSGRGDSAEVRVQWPDGEVGPWLHVAADGFAHRSSAARPPSRPWQPPRHREHDAATPITARLAAIDLPDFGMPETHAGAPGSTLRRPGSTRLRERADARGLRPARRVRRSRAQRQPVVPDRLRPALRGGAADRRAGRRTGDPRRQRVLRDGRRRAAADAPRAVPGPEPAEPAARPVAAARARSSPTRGSGRAAGSASSAGRRTRPARPHRAAGLPRRRAARADRAERPRRERRRPAHRRGRRPAGHQRGRAAGRARGTPPARPRTGSAACSPDLRPGHDRARGGPPARAGTGRRCPAT